MKRGVAQAAFLDGVGTGFRRDDTIVLSVSPRPRARGEAGVELSYPALTRGGSRRRGRCFHRM